MNRPKVDTQHGFTLPVVLALTLIAAMLAASALSDATFNQMLATTHQLHKRAAHSVEAALALAVVRLNDAPDIEAVEFSHHDTTITVQAQTRNTTPQGFSSGRFVDLLLELHGSARGLRGVRSRLVEGLGRLELPAADCSAGAISVAALPAHLAQQLARFGTGITVLDSNADGRLDRIYAGDAQGRLWRFDVLRSNSSAPLLAGGVLADLRNALANRGFIAAPDVTLLRRPDGQVVLQIAAGTANTAAGPGTNRFFLVHDTAPFESWPQQRYDSFTPITPLQLVAATTSASPLDAVDTVAPSGFLLDVGNDQIVAASLTVAGQVLFTRTRGTGSFTTSCDATLPADQTVILATLRAADGTANLNLALPGQHAANTAVAMTVPLQSGRAICTAGGEVIADCGASLQFTRRHWRREGLD